MQEKVANTTQAAPLNLDVSVRVIEPVKNLMGFASVKFNDLSLIHISNAKSIEEIKSFLSRQKEVYKIPYETHPEDRLR